MIWVSVGFALCDDELMLMGGCTCSKHCCFLPPVFRLLCLFCLNSPFFVLLTCEIGAYLQVYIHFLTTRGRLKSLNIHRSWVLMQLLNGTRWEGPGKNCGCVNPADFIFLELCCRPVTMTCLPQVTSLSCRGQQEMPLESNPCCLLSVLPQKPAC